jgi:ectoine hydroxylase-related dioxygenase (phytanoyl-CoA dioxygenase family)
MMLIFCFLSIKMAFERLHTDGFCVLQSVVDAADVALHVAQIEAELNLSRKGGNGSTEKDRTLDAISIGARASWPTRGRRRIVETAPLGEGEHWARLRAGGRMRAFLDVALGADAWEIRSNTPESSTRFFYAPVVFPESPSAESSAASATRAVDNDAVVELLSWKEDFALHGAPPPPRCWQPVNRRRVRGKGWHIDTGPGFPATSARTLKGDPRQGLVALLVLSDWEVGGGGTCFVRGSHNWVCDHLLEREERDVVAGRIDTYGSEKHEDLNQWCVDEMLKLARTGTLRRSVFVAGSDGAESGASLRPEEGGGGRIGEVCSVVAKRGDVIIFHPWVIHCGTTNLRATPRLMANGMVRLKRDAFARSGHAVLARTVRECRAARAAHAAEASARATVRNGAFAACFDVLSPSAAPIERVALDGVPGAFILRGALSVAECQRLEGSVRLLHAADARRRAALAGQPEGECSLCTVTCYANHAHNLTRSP